MRKGEWYIPIKVNGHRKTITYYRYLVEQYIGHAIPTGYTVHHIDWNHRNNVLSNFLIVRTKLHFYIHRCGEKNLVSNLDLFKKE